MLFRIALLSGLLGISGIVYGQQASTTCRLTISEFPAVRGLRINQTPKTLFQRWPSFESLYRQADARRTSGDPVILKIYSGAHKTIWESDPSLDGVIGISFWFEVGQLDNFEITYSNYVPQSMQGWIDQAAPPLHLPITGWDLSRKDRATLTCQGFGVTLSSSGPSIVSLGEGTTPLNYPALRIWSTDSTTLRRRARKFQP